MKIRQGVLFALLLSCAGGAFAAGGGGGALLATVELALYKLWTGYLSRAKQASWAPVPLAA